MAPSAPRLSRSTPSKCRAPKYRSADIALIVLRSRCRLRQGAGAPSGQSALMSWRLAGASIRTPAVAWDMRRGGSHLSGESAPSCFAAITSSPPASQLSGATSSTATAASIGSSPSRSRRSVLCPETSVSRACRRATRSRRTRPCRSGRCARRSGCSDRDAHSAARGGRRRRRLSTQGHRRSV